MNTFIDTTAVNKQCEEKSNHHTCPVCESNVSCISHTFHENQKEFTVVRCITCGFLFVRPLFLPSLEERKLDYEYDTELLNSASLRKAHEKFIIGKEIKHVRNIMGQGTFSLLDIGCGTGWTTQMWVTAGFRATGLEPSAIRARLASERYGIRVFSQFLENLHISDTFDIVILRHMIEHFADPYDMTVKARSLLRPDGIAVIIVPNINCLGRYLFGRKWTWGIPYHCNFFAPKTLIHLVERAGFEIITTYQTPSPLLYPESLMRYVPYRVRLSQNHGRLNLLSLLPFIPLVILGHMMKLSENITIIARSKGR